MLHTNRHTIPRLYTYIFVIGQNSRSEISKIPKFERKKMRKWNWLSVYWILRHNAHAHGYKHGFGLKLNALVFNCICFRSHFHLQIFNQSKRERERGRDGDYFVVPVPICYFEWCTACNVRYAIQFLPINSQVRKTNKRRNKNHKNKIKNNRQKMGISFAK